VVVPILTLQGLETCSKRSFRSFHRTWWRMDRPNFEEINHAGYEALANVDILDDTSVILRICHEVIGDDVTEE
jgi:hypothetical protein